jgi:hypothetical protein
MKRDSTYIRQITISSSTPSVNPFVENFPYIIMLLFYSKSVCAQQILFYFKLFIVLCVSRIIIIIIMLYNTKLYNPTFDTLYRHYHSTALTPLTHRHSWIQKTDQWVHKQHKGKTCSVPYTPQHDTHESKRNLNLTNHTNINKPLHVHTLYFQESRSISQLNGPASFKAINPEVFTTQNLLHR